jgi:hypothetical protein
MNSISFKFIFAIRLLKISKYLTRKKIYFKNGQKKEISQKRAQVEKG